MKEELKRCPFCSGVATLDEVSATSWRSGHGTRVTKYIAQCIIPSCAGHHGKAYTDKQKAIDMWNIRNGVLSNETSIDDIREMITSALTAART